MTCLFTLRNCAIDALVAPLLAGCIGSPLSSDSVAALYAWDTRDTPVTTREGLQRDGGSEYPFASVANNHPELAAIESAPWLLEACEQQLCYSMVLFSDYFSVNPANGNLGGTVHLSALSTLMQNQVNDLPGADVRAALDALAARLLAGGQADYGAFIALDTATSAADRDALLYPALYDEAVTLLQSQPAATVDDLLAEPATTTGDLVASPDFDFDSSWELAVDVDISARIDATTHYFMLCGDFSAAEAGYIIDYAACQLTAPLTAGVWQGELKLTGGVEELLAVVMSTGDPVNPDYTLWRRDTDGDALLIR